MIGLFQGSLINKKRLNKGFVVLHHELLTCLKDFTASEWMVLTCLSLHADETGFSCPSIARIAEETGISSRLVSQCIKSLSTAATRAYIVLRVEQRHAISGRQTSNGYVILPDGFSTPTEGEGAEIDRGEGAEIDTPITLKNIHKEEYIPPIAPQRGARKRTIKLPSLDDPARGLFIAYREVFMDAAKAELFTLGEWQGVHIALRQMVHHGVSETEVAARARCLIGKWQKPHMVTLHALWKHWGTADPSSASFGTTSLNQADRVFSTLDKLFGEG
jgi:hypothetical protein